MDLWSVSETLAAAPSKPTIEAAADIGSMAALCMDCDISTQCTAIVAGLVGMDTSRVGQRFDRCRILTTLFSILSGQGSGRHASAAVFPVSDTDAMVLPIICCGFPYEADI